VRRSGIRFNADAHPEIALLQVYDGHKKMLGRVPLALADVVVDHNQHVRFAVGYNNDNALAAMWRRDPEAEWTTFQLPGFRAESVIPRSFTADDRGVLFTGVAEGESIEALYHLDPETAAVERLYQHPEADIAGVVLDLQRESVIGVSVQSDKLEYHWLKPDDPAVHVYRMLQRAFAGKSVRITSLTRDGNLAVVFVYSDVNPGDYYLFEIQSKKATHLQTTRSWVDPGLMRPKEPIVVEAKDGVRLNGYLTRPRDGDGPFPLIVLPHGGPHGIRDHWNFDSEVQLLANRGYGVLQINFRGSGGYGMDFVEAGYGEWGGLMQDDITDATRWAIQNGITRADSICIFGASYGGYAALMGVVREPDLYRCAIGHAGVYDLPLMLKEGDTQRFKIGRALLEQILGEDQELLRRRSPVYNAELIEAPVLLIHGKEDWRADYEHAVRMDNALRKAGKSVEFLSLEKEGHGVYDEQTRQETYTRILEFLDRHLGAGAGPSPL
jgi:acetyl esterase/lipase